MSVALLAPWLFAALLAFAGGVLRRVLDPRGSEPDLGLDLAAGLAAVHLLLMACSFAGWSWPRWALLLPVALALPLLAWRRWRGPLGLPATPFGAGDALAAGVVALFAVAAARLEATTADFIYHWGAKAKRFALAGGIDWPWLAQPTNWRLHPDYPTLVPDLLAAQARLAGGVDERSLLQWSAVLLLALLVASRRVLEAAGADRRTLQTALAALALAIGTFAVSHEMAGSADLFPAWALLLAAPALLDPRAPGAAQRIGLAAALAAAAKIEGVVLAGLLAAAALLPAARRRFPSGADLARLLAPAGAVAIPWLVSVVHWGLFLPTNTGDWQWGRLKVIAIAIWEVFLLRQWNGVPWLLLLLPIALLAPRTRRLAGVIAALLAFFFAIYATGPVETYFLVLSSLPRLLFQIMPAALLAIVLAVFEPRPDEEECCR